MRHTSRCIDTLLKDEAYNIYNLGNRSYTADTVEHFLRYFWPRLESIGDSGPSGDFEDQLYCIYLDLTNAISHLLHEEKEVIGLLLLGYPIYGRDNIANKLNIDGRTAHRRLRSAYRHISEELRD